MSAPIRIVDGEQDSLERRIAVLLAEHRGLVVSRFTHWYTGRPPLYEATLHAPRLTARERAG